MRCFIPLAMMLTVAACGKGQETAQMPSSPSSAQTTTAQSTPSPVTTEPAQSAPQAATSALATPATEQSSGPSSSEQTAGRSSGSSGSSAEYTVAGGDTLSAIAREHNLRYQDIANWNNITDPNRIHEGQTLRLTAP